MRSTLKQTFIRLQRPAEWPSNWDWLGRRSLMSFDVGCLWLELHAGELDAEIRRYAPQLNCEGRWRDILRRRW